MHTLFLLNSGRTSSIDTWRDTRASAAVQVLGVVGFAILTALGAHVRLYLWEVPFTLQTAAVYGSGLYLGWRNGLLAQVIYVAAGMFFPVYAGEGYGVAYLAGSVSAGYLLAFPLAALVAGLASRRWNTLTGSILSLWMGSVIIFFSGVIWLHYAAGHESWAQSIDRGWLRFAIVDLAKILFVALSYGGVRRLTGVRRASSDDA